MLKTGMIIAERYEILGRSDTGGMADVYKAKDHKAQVITECDKTIFKKEKIQNKPKILIVDDSEFNRAILKEILEETYEIIEADGGNEALHKIDEYGMKISLVLLDIIMPEKDGFVSFEIYGRRAFNLRYSSYYNLK